MSTALGALTIVKALEAVGEFIGHGELAWNPVNPEQEDLIRRLLCLGVTASRL